MRASIYYAGTLAVACLGFAACTTVPQQEGLLEAEIPQSKISSRNLRAMVSEYVPSYAYKIEATADTILAGCEDPAIRKNALRWKINGISSAFSAASRPDPLASFCDLWVLTRQMLYLAESGEQPSPFGDWQQDVIVACRQLDARCVEIDRKLEPNLDYVEAFVEKTARQHPMEDLYFNRAPLATENIEKIHQPKHELLHVLASMQDDVKDIQRLSALYAEYLPKQARWQAELLALGVDQSPAVREALADFNKASSAMQQLARSAGAMQNTVDNQLAALPEVVNQQRIEATDAIENMQAQAMAQLRVEREAVMQAVHQEQEDVRKWVESTALVSADRADVISRKRVSQSAAVAERLLDRAAFYASTLLGVAGFLGFLFFAWFRLQRHRNDQAAVMKHHLQADELDLLDGDTADHAARRAA